MIPTCTRHTANGVMPGADIETSIVDYRRSMTFARLNVDQNHRGGCVFIYTYRIWIMAPGTWYFSLISWHPPGNGKTKQCYVNPPKTPSREVSDLLLLVLNSGGLSNMPMSPKGSACLSLVAAGLGRLECWKSRIRNWSLVSTNRIFTHELFTKCARPATVWANSNVISPKVRCLLWLLHIAGPRVILMIIWYSCTLR